MSLDRCLNLLPEEVMQLETITTFERHLDRHLNSQSMEVYGPNADKCY